MCYYLRRRRLLLRPLTIICMSIYCCYVLYAVDLTCDDPNLTTLCSLIQMSDQTLDAFSNDDITWTVFAPTDTAFEALDDDLADSLLNCTSSLSSILSFHTVHGAEVLSTDLECGGEVLMANGDESRTICRGGNVYQKGEQNPRENMPMIIAPDVEACNGVVHVVNEVMLPKSRFITTDDCDASPAVDDDEETVEREEACKSISK